MRLFLDVPFEEKDEVKALGARWNPKFKKWYAEYADFIEDFDELCEWYVKFAKWILRNDDAVTIVKDHLYIIQTMRECWKCHRKTPVIGLGVGNFFRVCESYDKDKNAIEYMSYEYYPNPEEIHLAWVDKEDDIPPKLLRYLKEHYPVRTGYSKFCNRYTFANHCNYCGMLQGNNFLFSEPDSPLSTCTPNAKELITRMNNITIYAIPIQDDLQLKWNFGWSSNDWSYLIYGKYKELILSSNPRNKYITYEELYS